MSLILIIKVVPNSGRNTWQIDSLGILKCYLKCAPEKGKANQELLKILSKTLKIKLSEIEILAGKTSRSKKIKISANLSYDQFLEKLDIYEQKTIFG